MRSLRYTISILLLTLACSSVLAQQKDVLFNRLNYTSLQHANNALNEHTHTGLKPVLEGRVNTSTTMGYVVDTSKYYYKVTKLFLGGHLVDIKGKDYRLIVDPQFEFSRGSELKRTDPYTDTIRFYTNTRGFSIAGDIGTKLSFQTRFYENQSAVPLYMYYRVNERRAFPGQGRPKAFGKLSFDYAWATGKVSWSPIETLNIQFGNDRHFVGHGYRSMLLSDNAFNYPFIKASALFLKGKVQYSSIFAKLTSFNRLETGQSAESLFYWKRATFQHVSIDLGRLQLALFESTHWKTIDSTGVRPLDPMEWNPVIGLNTAVNGFDSEHKQLIGLDARIKVSDGLMLYGQYATDDLSVGRKAFQVGARAFNLFNAKLGLQLEYNAADPFMYTNASPPMAYTHFGQELAHPYGADFNELVFILDKQFNKWRVSAKLNYATVHSDTLDTQNHGNDLYKPFDGLASDGGSVEHQLIFVEGSVSYILNPYYNMMFRLGYRYRDLSNTLETANSSYLYFSWQTSVFNKYYDF